MYTLLLALLPAPLPASEPPQSITETESLQAERPAVIELRTATWHFDTKQPAISTLTTQVSKTQFAAPADATEGFTIKLNIDLKRFDGTETILEIPDVLSVCLRQHDPSDRKRQNYPAFAMPDGSVPILEATLGLHSLEHPDWKAMTVGIPLAMVREPEGRHEVVLNVSGIRWTMYVDGVLLDNDFPFGYPQWPVRNTWKLNPEYVKQATLHAPAILPAEKSASKPNVAPVQYWTPPGHNCWVGDVVTFFYQGRYHVFYLYDRRHHASRFGKGAHYFEHISTRDFKTWIEHEAATPLEEQWECIGTGTPFVFDNKLCISYGLHTTRIYPREKTTLPAQWEYLQKHGRTARFEQGDVPGAPAGSTYAVSTDGVSQFRKSHVLFHPCENPSVYTDPSGRLRLLANYRSNGIWESESADGGWHCINPGFPPGGDCTFFFRWNQFDYIIGGFTGLWSKSADAPVSAYEDVVAQGLDFYDGLNVPAVTAIEDDRRLAAGWIPISGWGGVLVIRELVQFPDGRIGSKWMKEVTPETEQSRTIAAKLGETTTIPVTAKAFEVRFRVRPTKPTKGRFGISLLPETGEAASCEIQIRLDDRQAQFGPGSASQFSPIQKSLREGGKPQHAGNYAIENLIGVDQPFTVRLIVKDDKKLGGTLIDAEIAERRTMISYRPELTVKTMVFRMEALELENVQIATLKSPL